jgi:hypothetical protein
MNMLPLHASDTAQPILASKACRWKSIMPQCISPVLSTPQSGVCLLQASERERRSEDAAERAARNAAKERERAWERTDRERREFGGCYTAVLEALLQPVPKQARVPACSGLVLARACFSP